MTTTIIFKEIEDYQLEELNNNKLLINKYDLDLKYSYELDVYWKEFFFDMFQKINNSNEKLIIYREKENLLEFIKKNYKILSSICNVDIRDYPELTDYITLKEWENKKSNFIILTNKKSYLCQIK